MRKNHQTGNLKSFLSDVRPEAGGASFQTKKTGTRAEVRD